MWRFSEEHLFCNKFNFEVPLEDLYPPNYLHPKITLMYEQALSCFENGNTTLELLLSGDNESPQERLDLKENMLNIKHPKLNGSPKSFLWLIEHFLGLLPIPLLPVYMNGKNFEWFLLSLKCEDIGFDKNYKRKILNTNYCDHQIHKELAKLPSQHKLLLNQHMEFIRNISFLEKTRKKRTIFYYSKYFTASLIIRPFRSGLNENLEKEYQFLIFYMTLRWPYIHKTLIESSLLTISEKIVSESSIISVHSSEDITTQNKFKKSTNAKSRFCSSFNSIYKKGPTSRKISSLTSVSNDKISKISEEFSSISMTSHVRRDSNSKPNIRVSTYHRAEINNELSSHRSTSEIKEELSLEDCVKGKEQMIHSALEENSQEKYSKEKTVECSDEEDKQQNNRDFQTNGTKLVQIFSCTEGDHEINELNNTKHETEQLDTIQPVQESTQFKKTKNISIDPSILKRITKVGWTYTPPKLAGKQENFDHQTKYVSDNEISNQDLIKSSQSDSTLKKYPTKKSLKSRLSFLKIVKKKRKNVNPVIKTNFKYTKINS